MDGNNEPQVRGELFGYSLREEEYEHAGKKYQHTLVDLYIEDDGYWHLKDTFDAYWIPDLLNLFKNYGKN